MRPYLLPIVACVAAVACAAQQTTRTSDELFASPAAEAAREHAPDLYGRAKSAWAAADEAQRRKDRPAADDHRAEARLWLAAAITEADRIQVDRRRAEVQSEEERWAKQLARDQEAAAVVAQDISSAQARAVARKEVERLEALQDSSVVSGGTLDAVLARVRLNLALAEAIGATDEQLLPLRERAELVARKGAVPAETAQALLSKSEELIGAMRADWPEPGPGAATELVETAVVKGFSADRLPTGVLIRSDRFFTSAGQVSNATVERFHELLVGFPHGPIVCQVAVPELQSRDWARRIARLIERLRRMDDRGRVAISMAVSKSLGAGVVQCTFAAYRDP